jgi:hypothetical protein
MSSSLFMTVTTTPGKIKPVSQARERTEMSSEKVTLLRVCRTSDGYVIAI